MNKLMMTVITSLFALFLAACGGDEHGTQEHHNVENDSVEKAVTPDADSKEAVKEAEPAKAEEAVKQAEPAKAEEGSVEKSDGDAAEKSDDTTMPEKSAEEKPAEEKSE